MHKYRNEGELKTGTGVRLRSSSPKSLEEFRCELARDGAKQVVAFLRKWAPRGREAEFKVDFQRVADNIADTAKELGLLAIADPAKPRIG